MNTGNMGSAHKEQVLKNASEELWKSLEALVDDAAEEVLEEHLGDYLLDQIPQEVLDLAKIHETYLKDSVVKQIQLSEREFTIALCLRALLLGLDSFGYTGAIRR